MRRRIISVIVSVSILFTAGTAWSAVNARALWKAQSGVLIVGARASAGSGPLTAEYGGESFPLVFRANWNAHVLKIGDICYDDSVTVRSESGESVTKAVKVSGGTAAGKECGGTHGMNRFEDYPLNCLGCHSGQADDVAGSTHYRWMGDAPDMFNSPGTPQGKLENAVNSYCVNILGDWEVCGSCHAGRGLRPDDPGAGLENIDCLVCHNEEYAQARTRLGDGSMGVPSPTNSMVRNLSLPNRDVCLRCHARAGGGDGVKRGDFSLATGSNGDPGFDVHMNTSGADLSCQDCHTFSRHLVIGKGSDLRPTDDVVRGSEIECARCHPGKDTPGGHTDSKVGDHVARVACQTCHVPVYAKVATEEHRDWRQLEDGSLADGSGGPGHPYTEKGSNLVPEYLFWNRQSDNYLLGDDAGLTYDSARGTYPTSRPLGSVDDGGSRIYPFKYKTAVQPKTFAGDRLIALDTFEYLRVSGDAAAAAEQGLANMGYSPSEPYEWVVTDTFQLLNHGVSPAAGALDCGDCHDGTARIDLQGDLGYGLKGPLSSVCTQCHGSESDSFSGVHRRHVEQRSYDCSWCHEFSRPERGLSMP